jgi:hypothetical protein
MMPAQEHTGLVSTPSSLTLRTKKRRAARLHDAADTAVRAVAGAIRAAFALAVIDGKGVLEVSKLAIGTAVVAQARPAGRDGLP